MHLHVGLGGVHLAAFLALPLSFAMLADVVFSDVAEGTPWVMVYAARLGANVGMLHILVGTAALLEAPREVVFAGEAGSSDLFKSNPLLHIPRT